MSGGRASVAALACCLVAATPARAAGADVASALEVWLYGARSDLRQDAELNPGNALRLPERQWLADARLNVRARWPEWPAQPELVLHPSWVATCSAPSAADACGAPLVWNQAYLRLRAGAASVTAGRELLTWGPASYRSPSHPLYFNSARSNPLANTPGVDLLRVSHSSEAGSVTLARITSSRTLAHSMDLPRSDGATLARFERQGDSHVASLVLSRRPREALFIGGFAQWIPDDAWLLYGEWNSRRPQWVLPADAPAPQAGRRGQTVLLGASYTRENGQSVSLEYLYSQHGLGTAAQRAFQARQAADALRSAMGDPGAALRLAQSLALAPQPLGARTAWLGWQSNPQETGRYWRLDLAHNPQDGSSQLRIYREENLQRHLSIFGGATINGGARRSEFGALSHTQLSAGVKLFLF